MSSLNFNRSTLQYTGIPMRAKIIYKPCFPFFIGRPPQEYRKYQEKYNRIDALIDANPAILDAVHADLASYCSGTGREEIGTVSNITLFPCPAKHSSIMHVFRSIYLYKQ